jgi:hypothetical protein
VAADDPIDHRALGVALRDVLHLLGERGPVLLAVDDVQWLDPSSSSALEFALRRLDASPVLLLLTRRLVDGAEPPGLEQAFIRNVRSGCRLDRSASARSIGRCTTAEAPCSSRKACPGSRLDRRDSAGLHMSAA